MNKKLIIIGVLGLAGAGAFLYFKSKNKLGKNDIPSSAGGLAPTSDNSVLSTNTTTTTSQPVQEISPASLSDLQAVIYLVKYPDLNSAFNGNLQMAKEHWVNLGKSEQRAIPNIKNSISSPTELSDDQAMIYLSKYNDLLQTFGINLNLAKQHWVNLGKAENRTIDIFI
jgi:hypothetical protein